MEKNYRLERHDEALISAIERFKNGEETPDDRKIISQAIASDQIEIFPTSDSKVIKQSGGTNFGEENEIRVSGTVIGTQTISGVTGDQVIEILKLDENKEDNNTIGILAIIGVVGIILIAIIVIFAIIKEPNGETPVARETTITNEPIPPTNSPTFVTPEITEADVLAPTSSPTTDWNNIFRIDRAVPGCDNPMVIPETIDVEGDPTGAKDEINKIWGTDEIFTWDSAPVSGNEISISLKIISLPKNKEWIELSNKVQVTVNKRPDDPKHVNVIGECAGAGTDRIFSSITMNQEIRKVVKTYSEVDYFKLEPGEFENFVFKFECSEPGTYGIKIYIDYSYAGQSGTITLPNLPDLVCPQSYTTLTIMTPNGVEINENYKWIDEEYMK